MFKDRKQAGESLVKALEEKQIDFDVVIAVPRGGVVVAELVANHFRCPLDVVMAKKMGSPDLPDYVTGAVSPDGEVLIAERVKDLFNIEKADIDKLAEITKVSINRRLKEYRNFRPPVSVEGKRILLVDDGIVSGFTMKAAIRYLKRQKISRISIAVPLSSKTAYLNLLEEVDCLLALKVPENLYAVGQYYEDFSTVDDNKVIEILKRRKYH